MSKVLYPGSFDPITKGHMNIINEASNLFDEVVVAILTNPSKKVSMFTLEERLEMIKEIYKDNTDIKVVSATGATVDLAILYECKSIIRGLRDVTDFEYEKQFASINKEISNNKVNTICLFADSKYQYVSSTMVKEVFNLGKDIDKYVDPIVKEKMKEKRR